MINVNKGA